MMQGRRQVSRLMLFRSYKLPDREAVLSMLKEDENIDLIIPRGGERA